MLENFKVPDFRDVSVSLTAPYRHSSSLDILSSSVCQKSKPLFFWLFIVSKTCFNKNDFLLLLNNDFSLFFELLATHITWPSEEDPAELCYPLPWIFQTQRGHGRIRQSKQPEVKVVVMNTIATSTVTSSHTTLRSVTSIGPHLVPFKPGSTFSRFQGPSTPHTGLNPDEFPLIQPHHTRTSA